MAGVNGDVKSVPKDFILQSKLMYTNNPSAIPTNPATYPKNININL